jgi:hypothetical protein
MAAPIKPGKKTVLGKTAYWLVPTLTTTGPLVTEVNSASGLNITCYLLGDQAAPAAETGKVELPRLLCETSTTETLDATKVTIPDFRGLFDPQAAAAHNDKKFWALVKDGYSGYLVRRSNVVAVTDAAITAGQFVDWFQVSGSIGMPTESAADASGLYVFDVSFACVAYGLNVAVA